MSNPFVGEIRLFAGNFAPEGWAFCNGAILAITENEALFALIGTTYGGNGESNFQLPDLQGRVPVHQGQLSGGSSYFIGEQGGSETVTLAVSQLPAHKHPVAGNGSGMPLPSGNLLGSASTGNLLYTPAPPDSAFAGGATVPVGGGLPHENHMPTVCVNYIISLFGIFPTQN
jgi:microcystin-dependent protein